MLIDCGSCRVRGDGCASCVVTVLLGPPEAWEVDETEHAALHVLAEAGLVPALRHEQSATGASPSVEVPHRAAG